MPTNEEAQARGAAARTHLLAVANRPVWNIVGGGLNTVEGHLFGPPLAFWSDEDEDDLPACGYTVTDAGIAVIPVTGTLVDAELSWWMAYLGYCSTPALARAVAAAQADGNVKDLFLHVNSPGGHASGLAAVADALWAVRQAGEKRVWAGCEMVCSAAYYLASQCEKVYLAPDAMAGCIGTLYVLSDWSGYYGQMGVVSLRVTSDGAETYKGAGARGTRITPAQQADYKRICNEYQALFSAAVRRGRGFSVDAMSALADGRVHVGANALALSLVDGIASPASVLSALGGGDDLDDLPGPPPGQTDGGEDDPDGDEAPESRQTPVTQTDLSANANLQTQENRTLSTKPNPQNPTGQAENAESTGRLNGFLAWLRGDDVPSEAHAAPVVQATTPHPVLAAALAAGLDTPEKLQAVLDERTARQEADAAAAAQALTQAREAAQSAAVAAFGQGTPQLAEARAAIAQQESAPALHGMTSAYRAAAPRTLRPGAGRQTAPALALSGDDGTGTATEQDAPANKSLDPGTIYKQRAVK